MDFHEYFPNWDQLTEAQQNALRTSAVRRRISAGVILHSGSDDCLGLLLIRSGQLRAYIVSDQGREITLYRLFERDICLLSASCMLHSIQFDLTIEAEKDCELWVIPPQVYQKITEESASAANYMSQLMATRFSEVMWLMEQIMWKSFDKRLANFLLEESALEGCPVLQMTHEKIGNHLGTAREVVTRMLRYFQSEKMVRLTRGAVEILDPKRLRKLADS